jgi:hypothetical protein
MIAALIPAVSGILDKFVQDKDEAAKLAHDISTLAERHAQEQILAQIEVNKAEAASGSIFKGGWRPATGWICAASLGYTYILQPFLTFALIATGVELPPIPTLDTGALMPILLGMLGLAGARSWEKQKGVASK